MIVYLAATGVLKNQVESFSDTYLLTSFFECYKSKKLPQYVYQERHITDSGAFSTFRDITLAKNFDWDSYVKKYIAFLKETKSKLFFEMDIDAVVGLEKVEYYRKQLEDATGFQPIPVWHANRKWEYFQMMCEQYPYVALGTTPAMKEGKLIRKNPEILHKFISEAHSKGAKIHGLGFTDTKVLSNYKFDSVDSTSWACAQFGAICKFNGQYIEMLKRKNDTDRLIGKTGHWHLHNYNEWVKYQKYML